MGKTRRNWEKPKLIILTRGEPDEFVLTACKTHIQGTNGPDGYDGDGCRYMGSDCSRIGS